MQQPSGLAQTCFKISFTLTTLGIPTFGIKSPSASPNWVGAISNPAAHQISTDYRH